MAGQCSLNEEVAKNFQFSATKSEVGTLFHRKAQERENATSSLLQLCRFPVSTAERRRLSAGCAVRWCNGQRSRGCETPRQQQQHSRERLTADGVGVALDMKSKGFDDLVKP
eukprot:scaffold1507_cov158-Ochromonas_danica.AAC.5